MKRSIILFLASLGVTLGVGFSLYFLLADGDSPDDKKPQPAQKPVPTKTTPADGDGTEADSDEDSALDDKNDGLVDLTPKDETPEVDPTLTGEEGTEGTPDGTDPNATEPAPEPAPEPVVLPAPSETPRSDTHATALVLAEILRMDDPKAMLQHLVSLGQISDAMVETLQKWLSNNKVALVEEIGDERRPDGSRMMRYRITSEGGQEDLIVDVLKPKNGQPVIESIRIVPSDKTLVGPEADAMLVAEAFMQAVRLGDMQKALGLVNGKDVTLATVAGLCMVFEEDEFSMSTETPVRQAFAMGNNAGYLIYLVSGGDKVKVGLELFRNEESIWRVKAVSMDDLLARYERLAEAEGGRYFPIVKNPEGGTSIALFFDFNEHVLTPRSLRQLEIVAKLLNEHNSKLDIAGHTDDVGGERYNQALSEQRAAAVKAALVGFGVREDQITTKGLGKSKPRSFFTSESSEQQIEYVRGENRRAEIYLDFYE